MLFRSLVVTWALVGIVLKRVVAYEEMVLPVALSAAFGACILVIGSVATWIAQRRSARMLPG